MWGVVPICTHIGREIVQSYICSKHHLLQDAVKIHLTTLQHFAAISNLEQGYWGNLRKGGTHTKGTVGNDRKFVAPYMLQASALFDFKPYPELRYGLSRPLKTDKNWRV